ARASLPAVSLTEVMARLDRREEIHGPVSACPSVSPQDAILPRPLHCYAGSEPGRLQWRWMGPHARHVVIARSNKGATARLLRIPAGRHVPKHGHGGLELTLVLAGAFCDETGEYRRGDLQEANEALKHEPRASTGEDCICLAVTDAPLRYSSLPVRLLQP
ncbi:MAG TPA: ChrR family anti-sigma-E factor, partial [Alphaproteobacteria bacterium]|nr:ChrR family anti-sigma-E factor [Alphaproteobacteria bacterium]